MTDEKDLPTSKLTRRPSRLGLSVNGTRVGSVARPAASPPIATLKAHRFGLRAHLTTLPLPEKPSDEVA
jgi:hypothetical protein